MEILNIEIKAKCNHLDEIRQVLTELNADYRGADHQIDTYFKSRTGRLKLREGNIENSLIYYRRENTQQPKTSRVLLYSTKPQSNLKQILTMANGVNVVVDKIREIYYIDNVKFHLDTVKYLGHFVEIEAIDMDGSIGKTKLHAQCSEYLKKFEIPDSDLIATSYSDMLAELH